MTTHAGRSTGLALLLALCSGAPVASAEDLGPPPFFVDCGAGCADFTRGPGFIGAVAGSTFVVTVVHLPPVPEEALDSFGNPISCEPVDARIDIISADPSASGFSVQLGDRMTIKAGESMQIEYAVPGTPPNTPTIDLSRIGFNLRAAQPNAPCSVVAGGFLMGDGSSSPIPLALLSNALTQFVFGDGFEFDL